jgi:hypothetical protein
MRPASRQVTKIGRNSRDWRDGGSVLGIADQPRPDESLMICSPLSGKPRLAEITNVEPTAPSLLASIGRASTRPGASLTSTRAGRAKGHRSASRSSGTAPPLARAPRRLNSPRRRTVRFSTGGIVRFWPGVDTPILPRDLQGPRLRWPARGGASTRPGASRYGEDAAPQ